jgi:hypothetical protein
LHSAPRGKDPAGATMVDEGAGIGPGAVGVVVIVADAEDDEAEEEAMKPLQRPCSRLHVLKAHCWSFLHEAWKLPQTGWSMELTA